MFLRFENTLSRHGHLARALMAALALCFSLETFGLCFHDHTHEPDQGIVSHHLCPCSLHAHTNTSCDHCPDHGAMCGDGSHHHGRFHFERPAPVLARVTDDSAPEGPGAFSPDSKAPFASLPALDAGRTVPSRVLATRFGPPSPPALAGVHLPLLI